MTFRVVLQGTFAPGSDPAEVKRQFMTLTGQTSERTDRLFAGRPVTIKSRASEELATRMARTLYELGAPAAVEDEDAATFTLDDDVQLPPVVAAVAPVAPPPPAPVVEPPEPPSTEEMYRAIIGPRNTNYYLRYFAQRDAGSKAVLWNWPCALWVWYWAAHRKLWGFLFLGTLIAFGFAFTAGFLVGVIAGLNRTSLSDGTYNLVGFCGALFVGAFGNAAYYRHARRLISESATISDPNARLAALRKRGDVLQGVWLIPAILVISVLLVILTTIFRAIGDAI